MYRNVPTIMKCLKVILLNNQFLKTNLYVYIFFNLSNLYYVNLFVVFNPRINIMR